MKITKDFPGLVDGGWCFRFEGSITSEEKIEIVKENGKVIHTDVWTNVWPMFPDKIAVGPTSTKPPASTTTTTTEAGTTTTASGG